jgi:superfamily II DNA or RNA helicase
VKLSRGTGVAVESRADDEIVARVKAPGRAVAPTVVLYPKAGEWECDCPSRFDPCEHVAAAVIALGAAAPKAETPEATETTRTKTATRATPAPVSWGRVVYRFARAESGLKLTRAIVYANGQQLPIPTTLSAILTDRAQAQTINPEQSDLLVDRLLESGARAVLSPSKLAGILAVLAGSARVMLDGRPVAVVEERILPLVAIDDAGDNVVLTTRRDPRVTEVVSAGLALCTEDGVQTLRPLGEMELTGGWLQNLPSGRTYAPAEIGALIAADLPDLVRRLPVDIRSRRLPRLVRDIPPRLVLDLHQAGDSLSVFPTLVYGAPPIARIDDGKMVHLGGAVPLRDQPAERALLQRLRNELDLLPGRRVTYGGADAPRFAKRLRQWRGDLTGDAATVVATARHLAPQMTVHATPPSRQTAPTGSSAPVVTFDLRFEIVEGGNADGREPVAVDAGAVVRAWREGLGLVPLDGGGWAELPQGWLDKHGDRLSDLLAARDASGRLASHALPDLRLFCEDLDHPPPPGLDHLAPLFEAFDRLPPPVLPDDLTATLRPYQREGAGWLSFLRSAGLGGILADDMGLGKTLQALCVAGPGTLIVCPTSVLHNWAAEVRRFRPKVRVCLYHGPGRQLDETADITLTTYALLRLDSAALGRRTWSALFLDEAQAIKNPDSQVARAAFALPADFRVALTGTPVENRLDELWSLVHFSNRGLLGGRREFDDRYARPVAMGEAGAAARLRQRIRPFVLRRLKRDVAPELPPRTEAVLHVELDERERAVYDAVRAATQADVVALFQQGGSVMKALEALLRLRQASCHAQLIPGQHATTSSKVEALIEALENAAADGHKALVFSQWTSLLDLIEPHLKEAGISFLRLDGSTRDRAAVTAGFQAPDGPPVMLVSLKAGGTGLNLTAADHVFLCDPWWNPAVEDQAADRTHRIGQQRPVMIYRMVALGTVEEKILALQQQKRGLADAALGDAGQAAALTREDLLALLA